MQSDSEFHSSITPIFNKLIEVLDPLSDDLRALKKNIGTPAFKNFEKDWGPIATNIRFSFNKMKELTRKYKVHFHKHEQQKTLSKTSLKIKKNKEKKHNVQQLTNFLSNNNLPQPLSLMGPKQFSTESNKNPLSLSRSQSKYSSEFMTKEKKITINGKIKCYVCKNYTKELHFFYDSMCFECGLFNYQKRFQKCDLTGKFAVMTGSRIKIGYLISLILLRSGCTLIATTRFPKDALLRFSKEEDFLVWKDRLKIFGLDLRNLTSVKTFCEEMMQTIPQIDFLINNAAQTIRHHPHFYKNLVAIENSEVPEDMRNVLNENYLCAFPELKKLALENIQEIPLVLENNMSKTLLTIENTPNTTDKIPINNSNTMPIISEEDPKQQPNPTQMSQEINTKFTIGDTSSNKISQSNSMLSFLFPENCLDVNHQQIDLIPKNSWIMTLTEVPFMEFAETQVINSWAPYLLCLYMKPFFLRNPSDNKHIVNVSSMEGRFNKFKKGYHPHTNMAKASLDMLTRTCGQDFAKDNIYMNSVDTGWVSEMLPLEHQIQRTVPLDELDGAMRVLDPIFTAMNGKGKVHSKFFKDYKGIPLIEMDMQKE